MLIGMMLNYRILRTKRPQSRVSCKREEKGEGAELKKKAQKPENEEKPWVGGARGGMTALGLARVKLPAEVAIDAGRDNPVQSKNKVGG